MEIEEFINKFAEHTLKHLQLSNDGDWKNSNKEVEKIHAAYKKIKEFGPQGIEKLIDLTESESNEVALMAAVYGMSHNSDRCLKALYRIADKEIRHLSFNARQSIENWKSGWKVDFDNDEAATDRSPQRRQATRARSGKTTTLNSDQFAADKLSIDNIPDEVAFQEINDPDRMEERFFTIIEHYGDIVGMNEDSVEFCPNHNPPVKQTEVLPWLWLIKPELGNEIQKIADNQLKEIIAEYEEG